MSELRTNKIYPRDGLPAGASGGGIVQVVQEIFTTVSTVSSTSFVDVGLSASITPTSSSNKILVIGDISSSGANGQYTMFQLVRGSTNIYLGTSSKTYIGSKVWYPASDNAADGEAIGNTNMFFLDSPATTSAVTYNIQMRVTGSSSILNGRASDDTSLASSITLMEVSG